MALTVQTNNAAITALKHLNTSNISMNRALERLSSGFRINSAADDASGYAISSKLNAQGERLKAAVQNGLQATAMVKMADAAVNEIQNMIVRVQTLAIQGASANNTAEAGKLDAERIKLEGQIDKIANGTNYNGVSLLNGTGGGGSGFTSTFTQGTTSTDVASGSIVSASTTNTNAHYDFVTDVNGNVTITDDGTGGGTAATAFVVNFVANSTVTANLDDGSSIQLTFAAAPSGVTSAAGVTSSSVAATGQSSFTAQAGAATAGAVTNLVTGGQTYTITSTAVGAAVIVTNQNGETVGAENSVTTAATAYALTLTDGNTISFTTGTLAAGAATLTSGSVGGTSTFQVGDGNNTDNQVTVNLGSSYTTTSLGLGGSDLLSAANSSTYIDTAVAALDTLTAQRADLGATQNQLSFVNANLATSIEQVTSAVSSIRDADMAAEMTNFTKSQILVQAGTSMLAQANQASQNVLSLFR